MNAQDSLEVSFDVALEENNLEALYLIASVAIDEENDRSLEYCLKVLRLAKQLKSDETEGKTLYLMGRYNFHNKNYESALNYAQKAMLILEKFEDKSFQSELYLLAGEIYFYLGNYELALEHYQKVIIQEYESGSHKSLSLVFQKIGDLFMKRNQFSKALEAYENALEEFEFINNNTKKDIRFLSVSFRKIGNAYKETGSYDLSLEYYVRALEIVKKQDNLYFQGIIQKEISLLYIRWEKFDMAKLSLMSAMKAMKEFDNKQEIASINNLLGEIYFNANSFDIALDYYHTARKIYNEQAAEEGEVEALLNIAKIYRKLNNVSMAISYLQKAMNLFHLDQVSDANVEIHRRLSELYYKNGDYKRALEMFRMASNIKDSIYQEERVEQIAQMQIMYDMARKESENKILRQKSEIQELQIEKNAYSQRYWIGIILSVSMILILVLFRYWSRKKIIDKQRENEERILDLNRNLERRVVQELKKQEKQQQLLAQKSKLESLGQLAAGIAHEINQPLGGISMGLDNVLYKMNKKNLTDQYLTNKVDLLFSHVERIKKIIEHVRIFSRTQKPLLFEKVDINEVVNNSMLMVKTQFEKDNVNIDMILQNDLGFTIGDKYKMEQVVLNLLSNAKYAIDEKAKNVGSDFEKSIRIATRHDEENIYLDVEDNGIGMNPKTLKKIFDPFFTTKKEEKGTGLGLSITYGLVKDMLGEIKVNSIEQKYTIFEISLPRSYNKNI